MGSRQVRLIKRAVPDALYVNRGDPYIVTTIYDVRRDTFLTIAWGDWLEEAERETG